MTRFGSCLACAVLIPAMLGSLSCGSSRQLQSITLMPAGADARNFPSGRVQFTAIGTYNKPPTPVKLTSADVSWCGGDSSGVCAGNIIVGATVDQNGVAQCVSSFTGMATILAGQGPPPTNPDGGRPLKIFGSAQLTCP